MSDLYRPPSTGFEGTASDHLKEDMQRIQIKLQGLVGTRLRSINFWICGSAYGEGCLEGSFELAVRLNDEEGEEVNYKHKGPTLDDVINHVMRHIRTDMEAPLIGAGSFSIPKLIAAQ